MGNCIDKPVVKIGKTVIRKKMFAHIRTYGDALQMAGYDFIPGAPVQAHTNSFVNLVTVNAPFQIADYLIYDKKVIPIERLYGRRL
jgi:hypothetical protein